MLDDGAEWPFRVVSALESLMSLRIQNDAVGLVVECRSLWEEIGRSHPELGKQLRRSVINVPLNLAEGDGRWDGNGRQRLVSAMYEAKETRENLRVAVAAGFVSAEKAAVALRVADKIAATLWKIVGRPAV